ncbi:GntR family transcriptional regulator [Cupriavidus oxalaticus]|uniref:GntR family transcriptional regulator n=1 Tax=Cupriavidus oxalaticus TaxID=96344 RepID=A0A4P7LN59_9BURK|nr:GntR family transcriptional regulator [Cupriavidus oxalaticus]QBY56269.1 GntR family transcriptional regulator [Cupriavidus oxalaticus]
MSSAQKESDDATHSTQTRYAELASLLAKDITGGRRVVGSLLPTELELADQYGVSRHTVRAALKVLQELGYINRKKAVGTVVASANPSASYTQSIGTIEDLVHVAATEVRVTEHVKEVTLDRELARRLEAPIGSHWTLLSGTRVDARKSKRPVAQADIYVDAALTGLTDIILAQPATLVSEIIERERGMAIDEIRQIVTAVVIAEPLATKLGVQPGSAGLHLVRHYKRAGKILEISDTVYPADRTSVTFHLKRSPG